MVTNCAAINILRMNGLPRTAHMTGNSLAIVCACICGRVSTVSTGIRQDLPTSICSASPHALGAAGPRGAARAPRPSAPPRLGEPGCLPLLSPRWREAAAE
ncbi:unnamed protein product [Prorocentrum cordatum]|uniref:Uncharacterized protein n=1 Tax=Prorocentrum cordatum TaxID=2364126 RepID=A0ABN9QHH6_9DINO|nr:unnamed protein product [Polarella glacialis]